MLFCLSSAKAPCSTVVMLGKCFGLEHPCMPRGGKSWDWDAFEPLVPTPRRFVNSTNKFSMRLEQDAVEGSIFDCVS